MLKRNLFELLGKYGYSDGLVKYAVQHNGAEMSDLQRLRLITGNPNITWKEYKLSRFDDIEEWKGYYQRLCFIKRN